MKIFRSGHRRNSDSFTRLKHDKRLSAQWGGGEEPITLYLRGVHETPSAKYNYQLLFTLDEVGRILQAMANTEIQGASSELAQGLGPYLPDLLRLALRVADSNEDKSE